jgi:hypothetical protein
MVQRTLILPVCGFHEAIYPRLNTKLEANGYPPMTSLVKDLSDGVRLIQLMVRRSTWLPAFLLLTPTTNVYLILGDHGYVASTVFSSPNQAHTLYVQVILPLDATTGIRACVCSKRRT